MVISGSAPEGVQEDSMCKLIHSGNIYMSPNTLLNLFLSGSMCFSCTGFLQSPGTIYVRYKQSKNSRSCDTKGDTGRHVILFTAGFHSLGRLSVVVAAVSLY